MSFEDPSIQMIYQKEFLPVLTCGCHCPEDLYKEIHRVLKECSTENFPRKLNIAGYDTQEDNELERTKYLLDYALLSLLDQADLIEHGSFIFGSWLTDSGKVFLEKLDQAAVLPDGYEELGWWATDGQLND